MLSASLARTVIARRKTFRPRFVPRLQRLEDRTDPSSFATPLLPEGASGGLIYDGSVDGSIVVPDETDTYTLSLDGGQTVALVAHPAAAGLQLTVRLSGPGHTVLAAATAAAQGADAVVQAERRGDLGVGVCRPLPGSVRMVFLECGFLSGGGPSGSESG
jgi:hypothetical protein